MTTLLRRLALSVAELDFIARAADLEGFPGLTDDSDPGADAVVLDGLRAHGIVEGTGDALELRADVATLLGAVLECDVSLELETAAGEQTVRTVAHVRDELAILQRVDDGVVALVVVLAADLPAALLALCGEDPEDGGDDDGNGFSVLLTREELLAAELGEGVGAARLAGYVSSATAPQRAGRATARGTLYGEPRAACAWVAGAGGTFVVHDRGAETEIVRAGGRALAEQLLALTGPPN